MKKNLLSILVLLGSAAMVASCAPKTSDTTPTGNTTPTDTTPTDTTPTDTTPTDTTPPHEHSWSDWEVTTPATCDADGVETRTCACGESETRPVPANDEHTWGEWEVTTPASCEEGGEEARECSVCGETETRTTDPTGHQYDEGVVTKEATVAVNGEKTYTCSGCGETYTEVVPFTGDPVCAGLSRIFSTLLVNLTGQATYSPEYIYENFAQYDDEDDTYWTGVTFNGASPAQLSSMVTRYLGAAGYSTFQGMTSASGQYYGFFADPGVEELTEDVILYQVLTYTSSSGAGGLQVTAAYATFFME